MVSNRPKARAGAEMRARALAVSFATFLFAVFILALCVLPRAAAADAVIVSISESVKRVALK